jgi:hypothetical protein
VYLLPALSLAGCLLRGRRDEWKMVSLLFLITLVVTAPWYIAVIRANGFEFIQIFSSAKF